MRARPQDRMSSLRFCFTFFFLVFSILILPVKQKCLFFTLIKKTPIVTQNKRRLKVVAENANEFLQNFNMTFRTRAFHTLLTKFRLVLWESEKILYFNTRIPQTLFSQRDVVEVFLFFAFSYVAYSGLEDRLKRFDIEKFKPLLIDAIRVRKITVLSSEVSWKK